MHWDELAFFAGPSNLIVVAASSFILARYRTNAAAFDLSQPSHLYCEWSSQGYLWADLALAACAVVACVCILLPHYVPSAPSWLMDGLIDEAVRIGVLCIGKLVLTVIGLAFAFPAGFNHCKSGDFVLWVYCAFRIVGFLAGAITCGNIVIGMEESAETMPGWRENLFASFNAAIVGTVSFFLLNYDTPFASMDDALASPPPTWPAAVYSLLSNTSTEELPDLLLCEQSVSSYLYFELALSLSVVAQFSVWLYYGLIQYLKHGTLLEEGVLQLERGFIITLLLKGVSLVYGSVKVWTAKVCPTSNPLFYRLASCILISRYAEIAAVALWLPIDCARRRRDEALWRAQAQPQQKRRSVDGANAVNELTRVFLYRPRAGAAASDDPEEAPPKDATDASQLGGADPSGSAFIIAVEDGGETATAHPPHTILNLVAAGDGYTAADVEAACPPVEPTVTASRSPSLASQAGSVSFVGPLCFDTPSYSIVQCSICLCPFAKEDRIREIIQCKHSFHKECLELWWTRSWWGFRHCPVCRQSQ